MDPAHHPYIEKDESCMRDSLYLYVHGTIMDFVQSMSCELSFEKWN